MKLTGKHITVTWLVLPLGLVAGPVDPSTDGNYIVTGFGGVEVFGDTARAQQTEGRQRGLSGGIEALHFTTAKGDMSVVVDAHALAGDDEHGVDVRFRKGERWRLNVGAERSRTYYDGSTEANLTGGVFPAALAYHFFDEALFLDRSKVWVEAGVLAANGIDFNLRYEHTGREGDKSSTIWGYPTGGTRKLAPAVNRINESTDSISLDVKRDAEDLTWKSGVRWDHIKQENNLQAVVNTAGNNFVTHAQETTTDVVSGNGYVKKRINEKLTFSVGALAVTEDSDLAGSRYQGATPGATTTPTYTALVGGINYKEVGANVNFSWSPNENWTVIPSFRLTKNMLEGTTVSVGGNTGTQDMDWQELAEAIEARYRGFKDWSLVWKAESVQGSGSQINDITPNSRDLFLDQTSVSQKYSASAYWYYQPGLSYAAQYYYKVTRNDNDPLPGSADYFVNFQRFETHDTNLRINWRPTTRLGLVTRYDFRVTTVDSRIEALPEIESSRNVMQVLSETATWQPTEKLYVVAAVSAGFGELSLPISSTTAATNYVTSSNSDYISASLSGGYIISKRFTIDGDYTHYSADNVINNSAASVVYGVDENYDAMGLTLTVRASATIAYSIRYAFSRYEDDATLGRNDYDAHSVYAKMQYNF